MVRDGQRGFTLVEIVVVLAISGILMIIAFSGLSGARQQSQFMQSVDGAKEAMSRMQAASFAGVNSSGHGDGASVTNPCQIIVGQLATFGTATTAFHLLNTRNTQNAACGSTVPASMPVGRGVNADPSTYTYDWQLTYIGWQLGAGPLTGGAYNVSFTRSLEGAHGFVSSSVAAPANYAQILNTRITTANQPLKLWFRSPAGRRAYIQIDATAGVTRVIQ